MNPLLHPIKVSKSHLFYLHAPWIGRRTGDVSSSNEHTANRSPAAVYACLFGRYLHIFFVLQTNRLIMSDKCWHHYTWRVWHLILNKCEFFTNLIDYLCQIIRHGRLEVSTRMIDPSHGLEYPITVMELRSPLGLGNVSRRLLSNFVSVAAQLNNKHCKGPLLSFVTDWRTMTEPLLETLKEKFL